MVEEGNFTCDSNSNNISGTIGLSTFGIVSFIYIFKYLAQINNIIIAYLSWLHFEYFQLFEMSNEPAS